MKTVTSIAILASLLLQVYAQDGGTNRIFAVGGNTGTTSDVEIVDLPGSNGQPCKKPADYPDNIIGADGIYLDGQPFLCGGTTTDWWGEVHYHPECYTYSWDSDSWEETEIVLPTERSFMTGIMLNDSHWWITGGSDGQTIIGVTLTELFNIEDKTFSTYEDLPMAGSGHSLVQIDESRFFLCCGYSMFGRSFIFDTNTREWTETPPSVYDHDRGFAGMVIRPDGKKEILVIAGDNLIARQTEYFDPDTMEWRSGPEFPLAEYQDRFYSGTIVPYGDSFLLVGGYIYGYYERDEIWTINVELDQWERVEATLDRKRSKSVSLLIPDGDCL